jgi:ribosomal protein S18 acetylase RimI-like enzyme
LLPFGFIAQQSAIATAKKKTAAESPGKTPPDGSDCAKLGPKRAADPGSFALLLELDGSCEFRTFLDRMQTMMTAHKRTQFIVQELRHDSELTLCANLDHTFETELVWQMDMREEGDDTVVRFRTVRLPRRMQVDYPRDRASMLQTWSERDCFLIASVGDIVLGYINMKIDRPHLTGWIADLAVGAQFRRRRVGSALLEQATRWAHLRQINRLMLEMQTKNYPAINFAQKHGFSFCGFNDQYYSNQDIAVFFGRTL